MPHRARAGSKADTHAAPASLPASQPVHQSVLLRMRLTSYVKTRRVEPERRGAVAENPHPAPKIGPRVGVRLDSETQKIVQDRISLVPQIPQNL